MQHGFDTEKQLAEGLKYAQIFGLDLRNEQVRSVIENHSAEVAERLDTMYWMAMLGIRHS